MAFFLCNNLISQNDTIKNKPTHSPRKATIYSAVLPGLGQAYNKKYWKIPIVYIGIGGCLTTAYFQNQSYIYYRSERKFRFENNGLKRNIDLQGFENIQLEEYEVFHRRWRDNFIMFSAVFYLLNIIDANVDAHLTQFDVGNDLSLNIQPISNFNLVDNSQFMGLSLRLSFK